MGKNKIETNCDGCYSRRACDSIYVSTDSKCPCNTCIVKMVFCTGCEEYTEFRKGAKRRYGYSSPSIAERLSVAKQL